MFCGATLVSQAREIKLIGSMQAKKDLHVFVDRVRSLSHSKSTVLYGVQSNYS